MSCASSPSSRRSTRSTTRSGRAEESALVDRVGVETVAKSLLTTYCFWAYLKSGTNREPRVSTFKSGTNRDKILDFFFFGTTYQPISSDMKWGTNPRY